MVESIPLQNRQKHPQERLSEVMCPCETSIWEAEARSSRGGGQQKKKEGKEINRQGDRVL